MSCRCRCVPLPAWQGTCAVDFFVITWLLLLLHVTTHYCYLDVLEQDHCVHMQQHGMEVQEAMIGGQRRDRRYLPNTSEESWQFLLGVAPSWCLPSLDTSTHPNRLPTVPCSLMVMSCLCCALLTGPDIAADAEAATQVWVIYMLLLHY